MNCSQVRASLPLLVYEDLSETERAPVEKHLAECRGCQGEYRALLGVRQTLGMRSAPSVEIDLPRLYQRAAARQDRRLRRWRRVALAATSVAAMIGLLVLALRLEARFEAHQLVLRWGAVPEAPTPTPSSAREAAPDDLVNSRPQAMTTDEQVRLLSELVQALADNQQSIESHQRRDTAELLARLRGVQQQSAQRWTALERNLDSLYQSLQKGE